MSAFVLDASYALTWCFPDRATPATEAVLARMESRQDQAIVPWIWQVEIGNALGKAVARGKVPLPQAHEVWKELTALPIRAVVIGDIPGLIDLAVKHGLSLYDTIYLRTAEVLALPLATNDRRLADVATACGLTVLTP